ncbi:MAG TPA: DNA replication/repair protein RecF [Bacilli bacterium]|nr:DNA replication/repair protein RecF [Bacilli bacterium]
MQIVKLKLVNFRNYKTLNLSFSKKRNIFYGENGSGKTNILESIYVLSLTKSFRTINDKVLITSGEKKLKIEGEIKENNNKKYYLELSEEGKKVKINKTKIIKLSEYISNINVVLFSPDDFRIIKDSPSVRRKILNVDIIQFDKEYLILLNKYNKLLKQRNSYLRTMYINNLADEEYLNILTNNLIELGLKIYQKRKIFLENINNYVATKFLKITKIADLKIEYISEYRCNDKNKLKKRYSQYFSKELALGKTIFGVHHDDYKFILKKQNIKDYGSEGQQKNAIIAYKLSLIEVFKNIENKTPILLLDDLFSELDNKKINNIINLLKKRVQVFITTTDVDKINKKLLQDSKIFKVKNGKVEEIQNET